MKIDASIKHPLSDIEYFHVSYYDAYGRSCSPKDAATLVATEFNQWGGGGSCTKVQVQRAEELLK